MEDKTGKQKQQIFKVSAEDFAEVFGRYLCTDCNMLFQPPSDRPIKTHARGAIWEQCKCGGRFKRHIEDSKKARFRGDLTFEENKNVKKSTVSRIKIKDINKKKKNKLEHNEKVDASRQFAKFVSDEYIKELPELFKTRSKFLFEKAIKFLVHNEKELKLRKVSGYELTSYLSANLISFNARTPKLTAYDLMLASDFYWAEINKFMAINKNVKIVPTLYQFCSMIGISSSTFVNYSNMKTDDMEDTCQMIRDKFKDFITVNAMNREIDGSFSMFTLKASFGLRDNPTEIKVLHEHVLAMGSQNVEGTTERLGIDGNEFIEIEGV